LTHLQTSNSQMLGSTGDIDARCLGINKSLTDVYFDIIPREAIHDLSAQELRQDLLSCILSVMYGDAQHWHRLLRVLRQATTPHKVSRLYNVCKVAVTAVNYN